MLLKLKLTEIEVKDRMRSLGRPAGGDSALDGKLTGVFLMMMMIMMMMQCGHRASAGFWR